MIKMLVDASIPDVQSVFGASFEITYFASHADLIQSMGEHEILLCRSTLRVGPELLMGTSIRCVATVSSGTDHIAESYLQEQQIHLIDAKGANARAVTDYVVACLASLHVHQHVGAQRVGVLGVGAVGAAVSSRLRALGLTVSTYDPPRAQWDRNFTTCDLEELLSCDLLSLHVNLHDGPRYPSRHLLNAHVLAQLKPGTVIINAARGDVVDESALLACAHPLYYCTDVYRHEPNVRAAVVAYATLCTPHIAGHSIEARTNALQVVSKKIHDWLGLAMLPVVVKNTPSLVQNSDFSAWQTAILSLYNPVLETQQLKEAGDLPREFSALRKAHQYRHDFNHYAWVNQSTELIAALGLVN